MKSSASYYTSSFPLPLINQNPCKLFNDLEKQQENSKTYKVCEICQKDEKVFLQTCITCHTTVHNHCYQLEAFQDPWQCQSCLYRSLGFSISPCEICFQSTGALRQFSKGWYHIICLTWPSHEMLLEGKCGLCTLTAGKFVNCEVCWESFHPYCGFLKGLRYLNQRISCDEHLDFKELGSEIFSYEKDKNEVSLEHLQEPKKKRKLEETPKIIEKDENLTEQIENKEEIKGKPRKNSRRRKAKKGKKRAAAVKKTDKNKVVDNSEENIHLSLNQNIAKLMSIKPKGTTEEVCLRFEDYLFNNCTAAKSGYMLNKNLKKAIGVDKILYRDLKETVLRFCT